MSTQGRVGRKVEYEFANWLNIEELVETGGMVFPDGSCIELIKDADGSLAFLDSRSNESLPRIKVAGQEYIPPELAPSMLQAVTLPTERIDCGLTVELFTQIYSCLLDFGVSEEVAIVSTYFAFASWFPEFLPVAPCLIITGPVAEARNVLELLACVVRHALPLAEIKAATFHLLPILIQPTLLIGYIHPQAWRIFFASNNPRTYLPNRNGLTDLYSAKAVYAGSSLGEFGGDAILNIHCTPNSGKLPAINQGTLEKIAAYFQPKLLDYRLKHIVRVRAQDFDVPTLPTPLRVLARALGSCIVDAPKLQGDIARLLESQREVLRASRPLDPDSIALEALLVHCHGENGPIRVGVSEIAVTATGITAGRGEPIEFESKATGGLIRRLGFIPKRDGMGFAIYLTPDVRRLIHSLGRDRGVGDSRKAVPGCPDCVEVAPVQTGETIS